MTEKQCDACGRPQGGYFCVRCKRESCEDCWSSEWELCVDCASYKNGVRWDIKQNLMNAGRAAEFASAKMESDCSLCPILRDQLLYNLKTAKNLAFAARQEGLLEEEENASRLRQELTEVSIEVLVRQGLQANGDLWRHL
ncbi:MAG: hypothetical protein ACE5H4_13240 [Candidatus Thorarchaeota archaeon]